MINNAQILVTVFAKTLWDDAIKISSVLRAANISTELYTDPNTKLEKQLKYADKKSIPYVIVQGPDEVSKNVVQLKDMKNRTSEILTIEEVMKKLKS